jgi:hypothetical protein
MLSSEFLLCDADIWCFAMSLIYLPVSSSQAMQLCRLTVSKSRLSPSIPFETVASGAYRGSTVQLLLREAENVVAIHSMG